MIELTRRADWEPRLYSAIEKMRHVPFQWGQHDCVLFSADLIEVITDVDLAAEFRDLYDSKKSALKILKTDFKGELINAVSHKLGEPVHKYKARRGDLVLMQTTSIPFLGIATGTNAVSPGEKELMLIPMRHWLKVWRV